MQMNQQYLNCQLSLQWKLFLIDLAASFLNELTSGNTPITHVRLRMMDSSIGTLEPVNYQILIYYFEKIFQNVNFSVNLSIIQPTATSYLFRLEEFQVNNTAVFTATVFKQILESYINFYF